MLILIGAVPERLVHGDQSGPFLPSSLAPPGPAVGFSTATLIQGSYTTTHEIDLRLRPHRSRIVALSNQSDFWKVNLPVFTGASPFSYRFWFCSHGYTVVSVVNISYQNKQKKSHLLTKFIKHRRTKGKFILLDLKSIGRIVESFAFKIYRIVICL